MKKLIKKLLNIALSPFILKDYFAYSRVDKEARLPIRIKDFYPQIKDKTITTGFDRHYVYHTSWATRVVKEINPEFHVDISSSLYFAGLLSAFIPVKFYDYRPANLTLSGLESHKGDLHALPFADSSVQSISCMHTIEHIGLGRYGDPIDPNGDLKAISELKRVTAPNGNLIIVVPVGKQKIEFNAHRIYSPQTIIDAIVGKTKDGEQNGMQQENIFTLKEFAYIPELEKDGGIQRYADPKIAETANYACGCFWFVKNN